MATATVPIEYEVGEGLKVVGNKLCVDTVNQAVKEEKRPITSNAVHVEVGNLDALLNTV